MESWAAATATNSWSWRGTGAENDKEGQMSARREPEKAQAVKPGDKSAWVPPRLETLPLREAMSGGGHPYIFDGATFYS